MQVQAGSLVDSRYEILGTIGTGGFGTVYKARQIQLDRLVALKMLNAELPPGSDAEARFHREAQAIAALHHRNLVLFYGYGVWQNSPYMAMEFIEGLSLQRLLSNGESLKIPRSFDLIKQVCDALSCAHTNGIVHRDLKPSNIMLIKSQAGHEVVKLIDFGLAKIITEEGQTAQKLTEAGYAIGSILYMSPEQCLGQAADHRSDVYSLGCTLQACVTGLAPFEGEPSMVVMQKHVTSAPLPLVHSRPDLLFPDGLQNVVNKCLAKDPEDRYQNVLELKKDLELLEAGRSREISAKHAHIPLGDLNAFASATVKPKRASRVTVLAVMLSLVAVALSFAIHTFSNQSATSDGKSDKSSADQYRYVRDTYDGKGAPAEVLKPAWEAILATNRQDHLLNSFQESWAWLQLAEIAMAKKDYNHAIEYGINSLEARKNVSAIRHTVTFDTVRLLSTACHRAGQPGKALKYSRLAKDFDTEGCSANIIEVGWDAAMINMLDCGKLDEAMKVADKLEWEPEKPSTIAVINLVRGEHEFSKGNYQAALKKFQQSQLSGSDTERTIMDICRAYIATNDWVTAGDCFNAILSEKFTDPDRVLLLHALLEAHSGNWEKAEQLFNKALQITQANPEMYTLAGFNYDAPLLAKLCRKSDRLDLASKVEQGNKTMINMLKI